MCVCVCVRERKRWFEGWDGVGWPDFVRESIPDCWCSIRKWPSTKWVCAYSGNTKNGSIRRRVKLAGWLIDSREFSQVVGSSQVEANRTERREFVLYPWIIRQPMKRSKMRRNVVRFRNSQTRWAALFWTFCSLFRRYWGQPKRRELQLSRHERTKVESRVFVASTDRRWWMELMWESSKLADQLLEPSSGYHGMCAVWCAHCLYNCFCRMKQLYHSVNSSHTWLIHSDTKGTDYTSANINTFLSNIGTSGRSSAVYLT